MKRYLFYIGSLLLTVGFQACKQELNVYDYAKDGLNLSGEKKVTYSFVYNGPETKQDTVWIPVTTMGFVYDYDRKVSLEQTALSDAEAAEPNAVLTPAVADVHYQGFDTPLLQKWYVIRAGQNKASIPVVLKRDPSLTQQVVSLKIRVRSNDSFGIGRMDQSTVQVIISDQLSKPRHWTSYLGPYGQVKHRWLIENTTEKWDDAYLYDVLGMKADGPIWAAPTNANYDQAFFKYLTEKLKRQLKAYNDDLTAQGKEPLKEANGDLVKIWK